MELLSQTSLNLSVSFIDVPPSLCDIGNAIRSLKAQGSGEDQEEEEEECVLLSEEHSLVLTCCWVSLKVLLKANE